MKLSQLKQIIKEEIHKVLKEEEESEENYLPLSPEVKEYIDNEIALKKANGEMENLRKVEYWEEDFEEELLVEFSEEYPDAYMISKEVEDYIQDKAY